MGLLPVSLELALDGVAAAVLLVLVALALLVLRRRFLSRRGGTFDCSMRLRPAAANPRTGQGWTLGIARYSGDILEWYRVFTYSLRPKRVLGRRELQVVDRREPEGAEVFSLLAVPWWSVRGEGAPVEFAMGEDALTGFLSWLEVLRPPAARSMRPVSGRRRAPRARPPDSRLA